MVDAPELHIPFKYREWTEMTETEANPQPQPDILQTMRRLEKLLKTFEPGDRRLIFEYLKRQGVVE